MPCYDSRDDLDRYESRRELDEVTRVACNLVQYLRKMKLDPAVIKDLDKETREWVKEHDEMDKERLEQEAADKRRKDFKKKALKKLNYKERVALGLEDEEDD